MIDKVKIASKNWADDYIQKHGDQATKLLQCAYTEGFMKGVELSERKHGYWKGKPIIGYSTVRCSECGDVFLENEGKWNYCPNCGAIMDKATEIMAFWKLSPYRLTTALESFEGITAFCSECGYAIDTHEGDVLPDHCPECGVAIDRIKP